MVTLGLEVIGAGIYGVAGSAAWLRSFRLSMHDTTRITLYSNVDTLYHSDDLTISFSEFAHGRGGCAEWRTYLGCGPFFASSFPHAATILLHSAFCFDTRIASGACHLPFLSFYLLALNWVSHLVDLFIPLKCPGCRDRNKNNCCFSALFPSS